MVLNGGSRDTLVAEHRPDEPGLCRRPPVVFPHFPSEVVIHDAVEVRVVIPSFPPDPALLKIHVLCEKDLADPVRRTAARVQMLRDGRKSGSKVYIAAGGLDDFVPVFADNKSGPEIIVVVVDQ